MNGLALFAGIGGIEIGLRRWVRTVCYVERDSYAAAVIRSRIGPGGLDEAPIWDDVATFDGRPWRGIIDIICGGFPCQDISTAGKRVGIKQGTRSGLWFEFARIIGEVRPRYVFVENVSALTNRGLDIVLGSLSEAGYDAVWTDIRASDVGAPHRRERMFILAFPRSIGRGRRHNGDAEGEFGALQIEGSGSTNEQGDVADARPDSCRTSENETVNRKDAWYGFECCGWDRDPAGLDPSSESFVGRVADGVPNRVDRLRCLGNAVVPQQAERAFEILWSHVKQGERIA